jgi:cytochrome c oxidase assembly factor CtaG
MLVSSLVVLAAAYAAGVTRIWKSAGAGRGISYAQVAAFGAGWVTLVIALASPLDEWSETLFVAHMAQHELLMVVAAPLIALSAPLIALLWIAPAGRRRQWIEAVRNPVLSGAWAALTAPATVWLLHAFALWIWHLPSLYQAALEHEAIHAVQHICFFATATLFWWTMAHGRYGRLGYGAAVVYLFATALHSGVLGALLAFSPEVWYPAYSSGRGDWGLLPLQDQQLAGLVMWVPAGLVFAFGGLVFFAAWLRESERRSRFPTHSPRQRIASPQNHPGLPIVVLLCACGFGAGCNRRPDAAADARLLERTASWAAAVRFAGELAEEHKVPAGYVHDVVHKASAETASNRDALRGNGRDQGSGARGMRIDSVLVRSRCSTKPTTFGRCQTCMRWPIWKSTCA